MDRKKILTIFGAAWLSAMVLTWVLYTATKAPKQDKMTNVVAAARDMSIGTRVAKADVKLVPVRATDTPKGALLKLEDAIGRTLVYPITASEPLTSIRLTSQTSPEGIAATIPRGLRAVSVPFTDATGASGLVGPKSRVDVLYTRTGNAAEAMTVTVLEDVEVLSIGRTVEVPPAQAPGTKAAPRPTNQTATLLVSPDQSRKLELARNQGKISLILRNPLDSSTQTTQATTAVPGGERPSPATMDSIDPMLLAVMGKRGTKRGARTGMSNAEWNALIGEDGPKPPPKPKEEKKEPPKPRVVVDVFRGEKHTQEMFQ
ncbi:MAG: Flp pilus assembly protein CpaB [Acidobacteria bacterium]|nr:Flp pilus assembly protein CpaB [Acidobacteriota bacterium]